MGFLITFDCDIVNPFPPQPELIRLFSPPLFPYYASQLSISLTYLVLDLKILHVQTHLSMAEILQSRGLTINNYEYLQKIQPTYLFTDWIKCVLVYTLVVFIVTT